jgi:hypothetical protein
VFVVIGVWLRRKEPSVLVELGVVEQRHQEVLDGAPVTVVARRLGWRGRRCICGCAGMPLTVAWRIWLIGRRGRCRAGIRCRRWLRADRGGAGGASGV